ncbi:MAG TPA: TetR/AcrR family transcriptional regulator [Kofleriaceae bacterium]|nr:TetR/AcrR family transcriptional regulator [Kofleriaceae bacterium]
MKSAARKRTYDSELRKQHAEHTAERILDAVKTLLGRGDRELAYTSIAREARVAVPTVYRHFPTQDDLFRAFAVHEQKRYGEVTLDRASMPKLVRGFYSRFDDPNDAFHKQQRLATIWRFSRVGTVPGRRVAFEKLIDAEAPGLAEPERTQIVDLAVVALSSAMGEAMRGYLELDGEAMAARALLMIEALLRHARELTKAKGKGKS